MFKPLIRIRYPSIYTRVSRVKNDGVLRTYIPHLIVKKHTHTHTHARSSCIQMCVRQGLFIHKYIYTHMLRNKWFRSHYTAEAFGSSQFLPSFFPTSPKRMPNIISISNISTHSPGALVPISSCCSRRPPPYSAPNSHTYTHTSTHAMFAAVNPQSPTQCVYPPTPVLQLLLAKSHIIYIGIEKAGAQGCKRAGVGAQCGCWISVTYCFKCTVAHSRIAYPCTILPHHILRNTTLAEPSGLYHDFSMCKLSLYCRINKPVCRCVRKIVFVYIIRVSGLVVVCAPDN